VTGAEAKARPVNAVETEAEVEVPDTPPTLNADATRVLGRILRRAADRHPSGKGDGAAPPGSDPAPRAPTRSTGREGATD
jgi:hypothetical protein